jgi:hypothetical protein
VPQVTLSLQTTKLNLVHSAANSEEVKTQWTEAAADRVRPAEDTGVSSVQSRGSKGKSAAQAQKLSQVNR